MLAIETEKIVNNNGPKIEPWATNSQDKCQSQKNTKWNVTCTLASKPLKNYRLNILSNNVYAVRFNTSRNTSNDNVQY